MKAPNNYILLTIFVIVWINAGGCATSPAHHTISLSMTRDEVHKILGEPVQVKGPVQNKYDQQLVVWQYDLDEDAIQKQDDDSKVKFFIGISPVIIVFPVVSSKKEKPYWLYFMDNTLVYIGEAGDWEKELRKIYDTRFVIPEKAGQR